MARITSGLAMAAVLGALMLPASGQAQGQPQGATVRAPTGVFSFRSGPEGNCPGLTWNVSREGDRLAGFITWNDGKSVARVTGTVKHNDFSLDAREVGGARMAKITGTISAGTLMMARISGVPRCEGETITVPWFSGADGDD